MKISIMEEKFQISIKEIAEVITRIGNYVIRENNALYIVLEIVNASLKDWYDEMGNKYQEMIANGMKPESYLYIIITAFIHGLRL